MPVLLAPSPHAAERNRAARWVWWFGLFLTVYAGLALAIFMVFLIYTLCQPSDIWAVAGTTMDQVILGALRLVNIHLLFGAAGAGLIVAARGIRCGMRWAYAAAFALSAAMAMHSALFVLPNQIRWVIELIVRLVNLSMREILDTYGWFQFLIISPPVVFHVGAVFLAALAIHAVFRLYWIERRATSSAARRNQV